eukprot:1153173-Pelagomonas_calceolata.AAC.1
MPVWLCMQAAFLTQVIWIIAGKMSYFPGVRMKSTSVSVEPKYQVSEGKRTKHPGQLPPQKKVALQQRDQLQEQQQQQPQEHWDDEEEEWVEGVGATGRQHAGTDWGERMTRESHAWRERMPNMRRGVQCSVGLRAELHKQFSGCCSRVFESQEQEFVQLVLDGSWQAWDGACCQACGASCFSLDPTSVVKRRPATFISMHHRFSITIPSFCFSACQAQCVPHVCARFLEGLHKVHTSTDEDGGLSRDPVETHLYSGSYVEYCRMEYCRILSFHQMKWGLR